MRWMILVLFSCAAVAQQNSDDGEWVVVPPNREVQSVHTQADPVPPPAETIPLLYPEESMMPMYVWFAVAAIVLATKALAKQPGGSTIK